MRPNIFGYALLAISLAYTLAFMVAAVRLRHHEYASREARGHALGGVGFVMFMLPVTVLHGGVVVLSVLGIALMAIGESIASWHRRKAPTRPGW